MDRKLRFRVQIPLERVWLGPSLFPETRPLIDDAFQAESERVRTQDEDYRENREAVIACLVHEGGVFDGEESLASLVSQAWDGQEVKGKH